MVCPRSNFQGKLPVSFLSMKNADRFGNGEANAKQHKPSIIQFVNPRANDLTRNLGEVLDKILQNPANCCELLRMLQTLLFMKYLAYQKGAGFCFLDECFSCAAVPDGLRCTVKKGCKNYKKLDSAFTFPSDTWLEVTLLGQGFQMIPGCSSMLRALLKN